MLVISNPGNRSMRCSLTLRYCSAIRMEFRDASARAAHGGKNLDLARGRGEAGIAVFLITGLERHADAVWAGP